MEVKHYYGGGASSSSKLLLTPTYKKPRLPERGGGSYGGDEVMFIYFGCSILVVERLHPLPLLISRAAQTSSTVSNGLTFLIKSSFVFKIFKSYSEHENSKHKTYKQWKVTIVLGN